MGLNIKQKLDSAIFKAAKGVGISWVLARVRGAATGEYGQVWKARYEKATSLAPWTGLLLACATAGFAAVGDLEKAAWVGSAAGLLMAAGVISRAYLTEIPPALRDSKLYQTLVSWAPMTTVVLGALYAGLESCVDPSCESQRVWILVAAGVAAKLGLTNAALQAKPPAPPLPPVKKAA